MITGIDLTKTVNYICKKDKKDPTTWVLGMIPSTVMADLSMGVTSGSNQVDMMVSLVRKGLKGFDVFNVAGVNVAYETDQDGVLQTILDALPFDVLIEIGSEILRINSIADPERKN